MFWSVISRACADATQCWCAERTQLRMRARISTLIEFNGICQNQMEMRRWLWILICDSGVWAEGRVGPPRGWGRWTRASSHLHRADEQILVALRLRCRISLLRHLQQQQPEKPLSHTLSLTHAHTPRVCDEDCHVTETRDRSASCSSCSALRAQNTLSHTQTLSHKLSQTAHTHSISLACTHTHHTQSLSHTHTLSLSYTHPHTHSLSLTHTLSVMVPRGSISMTAVVQSRNDKGLDKKLCSMLCQKGPDLSDVV